MPAERRPEILEDRPRQAGVPAPRDWRQDVVGVSAIAILLGAWLIVSPFVLGYESDDTTWNPIACGALGAAVALVQTIGRVRSSTPGWILIVIGVWMFASGLWLADSPQATWNAFGAGAAFFLLGSVNVAATQRG